MKLSMQEATNAIKEALERRKIRYQYEEEKHIFIIRVSLSQTKLKRLQVILELEPWSEDNSVCIGIQSHGLLGLKVGENGRQNVADYLHRVNWNIKIGKFILDMTDGTVCYRIYLNTVDGLPGSDALDDLVWLPVSLCNRYGDGLLDVSVDLFTPEEAIQKSRN